TYTQELAKTTKQTLVRLQNNPTSAEITSGKALNFLLEDASKYRNKKVVTDDIPLTAEQLKRLNITSTQFALGPLRDDGKISWPVGLLSAIPENTRNDLALKAESLVNKAAKGRIDANQLKDLRDGVEAARTQLLAKVNEIPGPQYLDARRFLGDLDNALT